MDYTMVIGEEMLIAEETKQDPAAEQRLERYAGKDEKEEP